VIYRRSLMFAVAVLLAQAQQARRIAVYSFQDIGSSLQQQVGQKLSDRLLSKLTDSGVYQMIDRQFLDQVMKEQQLAPSRFDDATAVKIGRLMNVSAVVAGTITTYTFNQRSSEDSIGYYGTVTVAATARLISTETGAILRAPVASEAVKGVVQVKPPPPPQQNCHMYPVVGRVCSPPTAAAPPSVETKTMEQLLDEAIEACARSLASDLSGASTLVPRSSTTPQAQLPLSNPNSAVVIGVSEGLTYVNKGSKAGLKVGQVFQVYRLSVVPGLTDPDTGKPLTRKTQICTLTLSDVEETNSSGKCAGNPPASQDNVDIGSSMPAPAASLQAGTAGGLGNGNGNGNGSVTNPVAIYRPEPQYSEEARQAKLQGVVLLSLVVDETGKAVQIKVIRSLGLGLDEKAIEAVSTWKFTPGKKDGRPVPVAAQIEVTFRL
jgi:TonB family protein